MTDNQRQGDLKTAYTEEITQTLRSKIQDFKENAQESETVEALNSVLRKMDDLGL